MRHALTVLSAGILAALTTTAAAETITSRILDWNPDAGVLTLEGDREMSLDPSISMEGFEPGEEVTVLFEIDEDGYERVTRITDQSSDEPALDYFY